MDFCAKWIGITDDIKEVCPVFRKTWKSEKAVMKAVLYLTALGVYEAKRSCQRTAPVARQRR